MDRVRAGESDRSSGGVDDSASLASPAVSVSSVSLASSASSANPTGVADPIAPVVSANPVVSVIVPMYNCARYLQDCLGSLRGQTFADFEVLCVDDASTDGSLVEAKRLAEGDERFTFLALSTNGGQSVARNAALDHARGTYVVLLDADDYLAPQALEKIVSRMTRDQLDDLYFNAKTIYEDGAARATLVEDFEGRAPFDKVATGPELFTFFEGLNQFYPHGALRAVRRDLIEEHGIRFLEGIIHEDLLFTLQTLVLSRRSSFLNEQLYMRRIRVGSTMAKPRRTMSNIVGHLASIDWAEGYLAAHAHEFDAAFIDAMTHRMSAYLDVCAIDYLNDVTQDEKTAYLASLSAEERLRFNLQVAMRAETWREIYGSVNWRVGAALTAAPRAIRNKLAALRGR